MSKSNGTVENISDFPAATPEGPADTKRAMAGPLPSMPHVIPIPPKVLAELRRLDAEITVLEQRRQGLWDGCAGGIGIDTERNWAAFDHVAGSITVTPVADPA